MPEVLTELVAKITTDASGLSAGLNKSTNKISAWATKNSAAMRTVGMAGAAIGAAIVGGFAMATKAAITYEDAFAGVRKTVDATEEQLASISKGLRDMSKTLPTSAADLAAIAESAGQLGIQTESILSFTEVIAGLGISTDITGQAGATMVARFAAVTSMPINVIKNMASTVVELGNNSKATEAEIMTMAMRIGGTASIVGMTQQEILGLSSTLVSLGIQAERGGTALNTTMIEMNSAVAEGGEKLKVWANLAGVSAEEFATSFREDAMGTIVAVIGGLNDLNDSGADTAGILQSVGLGGIRAVDTLFKLGTAEDELTVKVDMANRAWEENIALDEEVSKRLETTASKMAILKNTLVDVGITIGDTIVPILKEVADGIMPIIANIQEWITANPGLTKVILISAGAVGLLSLAFGTLLFLAPGIIATITAIGVSASIALGGIPILVGLIITAGVLLVQNWETVKVLFIKAVNAIIGALNKIPFVNIRKLTIETKKLGDATKELTYETEALAYETEEGNKVRDKARAINDMLAGSFERVADETGQASDEMVGFTKTQEELAASIDKVRDASNAAQIAEMNRQNQQREWERKQKITPITIAGGAYEQALSTMNRVLSSSGSTEVGRQRAIQRVEDAYAAIPTFHDGGIVPGSPGQEVPILAEAGERITPAGGGASLVVNVAGSVISERDLAEIIREQFYLIENRNYSLAFT